MVKPRSRGHDDGSCHEYRADPKSSEPEIILENKEKAETRLKILQGVLKSVSLPPYRRFVAEQVFGYGRSSFLAAQCGGRGGRPMGMEWPGEQSVRGVRKKYSGFWQDPRTLEILRQVERGSLPEDQATKRLRTLPAMPGHKPSDVWWYIRYYNRNRWPHSGK